METVTLRIFVVAFLVRVLVTWNWDFHFDPYGVIDSTSAPSNWKEFLFSHSHGLALRDIHVEAFPWLVQLTSITGRSGSLILLKYGHRIFFLADALLAALVAYNVPSRKASAICWAHALCPFAIMGCAFQSAASIQHLLLFVVVMASGSTVVRASPVCIRICLSIVTAFLLEKEFLVAPLTLIFDLSHSNSRQAMLSSVLMLVLGALLVVFSSIYAPVSVPTRLQNLSPDIGPAWYMWQLLPPVFDRPYTTIMRWMPLLMTAPLLLRSSTTIAKQERLQERRFAVVCWSVACAVVCRRTCSITDVLFVAKIWAVFTPQTVKGMTNLFVPLVGTCICIPLQRAFYRGWVTTRVANANWLFFACVFQMATLIMFQGSYLSAYIRRISA
jgi:hypothetical protein